MILLAALALGLPIGGVMGALGGGGGVLTVPALVYLLDQTPQDATAASLIIVGVAAIAAAGGHARAGTVRWEVAVPFGTVGIVGAFCGSLLSRRTDANSLMFGFALLMAAGAVAMYLKGSRDPGLDGTGPDDAAPPRSPGAAGAVQVLLAADRKLVLRALPAGAVVGLLTGFFGVGGGFLIVPALTLGLGLPMTAAVGTSLVIIAVNSMAGLAARAGSAHVELAVVVPFTLAAVVATIAGRRLARRLPGQTLARAFAALLAATALLVAVQSVLAT